MNRIDIFLEEEVKSLIDSFSYCFKVRITIFSADLAEKLAVGFYPTSNYCELVRETLRLKHRCLEQDKRMCLHALNSASLQCYGCHAGMMDATVPIKLEEFGTNGTVVGYAMVGQFRTHNTISHTISEEWRKRGFPPEILQNAFDELAFFKKDEMQNMLNLFSMLCDFIVSKRYIRPRYFDIVSETLRWVEKHIAGPLSFSELEKHLGYSQSVIFNALKKRLNMNFKQLCILKKVERFERIVSENPFITIEEAVSKIGYDASYFSRVYRKVRGMTPSAFIKAVQREAARKWGV